METLRRIPYLKDDPLGVELVQEISAASNEQNTGADQINRAIQQLDQVIQQNAGAAEEMASTSEELASQAEQLQASIDFFRIEKSGGRHGSVKKQPHRPAPKTLTVKGGNGRKQSDPMFDERYLLELDEKTDAIDRKDTKFERCSL